MVSFENFVKSMPPSLSELKVLPSFCFPIKIRDDRTASTIYALFKSIYFSFLLCALLNSEHKVLELKAVCTCWEYTILVEKYEQLVEKNCLIAK